MHYCMIHPLIAKPLCIPATLDPVERMFSQGGIIIGAHHAEMNDDLLEMPLYLRCNAS